MRSTISKLFLVPVIAAAAALATHTAKAETLNIPFSFSAMGKTFPAGDYKVQKDLNSNFVTLKQIDGSFSVTRILGPGVADRHDHHVVLRFDASGNKYALETIQFGSSITPSLLQHNRRMEEASGHTTRTVMGR